METTQKMKQNNQQNNSNNNSTISTIIKRFLGAQNEKRYKND